MAKGIKSASNLRKLDALGTSKDSFEVLKHPAGDFIRRVQNNLKKKGKWLTGKTANLSIEETETGFNIIGSASLLYVDKGVSGTQKKYNTPFSYTTKMPPSSVFVEWIKRKNLNLRNNANYKGKESPTKELTQDEQIESAAYAMAINKKKYGQAPTNVVSDEIQQFVDEVSRQYADYVVKSIFDSF
ncbi:MAG: hypothetical protein QM737_02770 [Ferruginibacter sp.]